MRLYRHSVYTIVDPDALLAADRGAHISVAITEKKPWTSAVKMLAEATERRTTVPLLLADARRTQRWLGWAELVDVAVDVAVDGAAKSTAYTFRNLRRPVSWPREDFRVASTGEPLPFDHIRPYVILETPPFFEAYAAGGGGPLLAEWLQTEEAVRIALGAGLHRGREAKEILTRAIGVAQEHAPSAWNVVLTPNLVRLFVGAHVVMEIGSRGESFAMPVGPIWEDPAYERRAYIELYERTSADS